MNKQEEIYDKYYNEKPELGYSNIALNAMKENALEFQRWLDKNGWNWSGKLQMYWNYNHEIKNMNHDELYSLYSNQ